MSETVSRRVVVAEDEALIRMDIVEVLRENGFDVVGEAADGEAAIELTRELRPDLVVMDITMPKMDGLTAAEAIGKERLAPVVMLTAFAQPEFVARAVEAGAIAYVVKPFTPEQMHAAVVDLHGECAIVICYESVGQFTLVATNVFVRETGDWKLVHHQSGETQPPQAGLAEPGRTLQ